MTATRSGAAADKQPVIVAACDGFRLVRNGADNWVLERLGHDAMKAPTWGELLDSYANKYTKDYDQLRIAVEILVGLIMKTEV